jgi:hypothetical protein
MKFKNIEKYILLSKNERTKHLKLNTKCVEIGGQDSRHYRGLLAWHLKTTIPSGMKIYLCHACNNHKCSNPNHLYWGTAKENTQDAIDCGKMKNIREYTIAKYGKEKYALMQSEAGRKGGQAPRKKYLSDERKIEIKKLISHIDLNKRGVNSLVAKQLSISPQYAGRLLKKLI